MSFVRAATAPASFLLAGHESFALIGSHEALPFLHRLLADLSHLLLLLLRRERRVGADALDPRMGLVPDGLDLFHHRPFDAGLLQAGSLASAVHGSSLRWRIRCRRSALRQDWRCAKKKNGWTQKFL
jgi:hypothetical protein